jgi:hypothetical protein
MKLMRKAAGRCDRHHSPMSSDTVLDDPATLHARADQILDALCLAGRDKVQKNLCFEGYFRFGPLLVKLTSNMVEAGRFFSHCLVPCEQKQAPDIDIAVQVGLAAPFAQPPAWNFPHTDNRHLERLHISAGTALCAFNDADRRFWTILDSTGKAGLFWISDWQDVPFWERAAPFKTLFNWCLAKTPFALLHGAVVGLGHDGLLLTGPGGAGKSTTVATCLDASFSTCGDDLVLIGNNNDSYFAYGVYDALKLSDDSGVIIPDRFRAAPYVPCGPKNLVRISDIGDGLFARELHLRAIMTCEIGQDSQCHIDPVSPAHALRALAPSTAFLLRGREQQSLQKIGALVRHLPCFRLRLARDGAENSRALRHFLNTGLK